MTYEEFCELTGFQDPEGWTIRSSERSLREWFAMHGKVTAHNGSRFHHRVDQYTLPNGVTLTREFTGYVDKAQGITAGDRWVMS